MQGSYMPSCFPPGVFHSTMRHPGVTAYDDRSDSITDNPNGHCDTSVCPPVALYMLKALQTASSSNLYWQRFFHVATTPSCWPDASVKPASLYTVSRANSIPYRMQYDSGIDCLTPCADGNRSSMNRSAIDGLAVSLHCKATLIDGVSGTMMRVDGLIICAWVENNQFAFPTRNPVTPSVSTRAVALLTG